MLAEIVIQFKKAVIRMRSSQNERCEKHKQFHSVHYEQAKHAETSERNLLKALTLYLQATWAGEKIDSCIKDFASVMHQLGETAAAVQLLEELYHYDRGDKGRYERLIKNLRCQLNPTGRHSYIYILIESSSAEGMGVAEVEDIFLNTDRIRNRLCYDDLSFGDTDLTRGKYVLLQFESFSAAKKTLEKLNPFQFGYNKYWVNRQYEVVCEAQDGKHDFSHMEPINHESEIRVAANESWFIKNYRQLFGEDVLHYRHYLRTREYLFRQQNRDGNGNCVFEKHQKHLENMLAIELIQTRLSHLDCLRLKQDDAFQWDY